MSARPETKDPSPALASSFLVSLIENAAATLEVDRVVSKDYLLRAVALLRTQCGSPTPIQTRHRGQLATWQVTRLLNFVDRNLARPIRAGDLAGLIQVSPSHLSRTFKASLGMAPHQFVIRRRVYRAQELLRTTDMPLAAVAFESGLGDQSSLCRLFRQIVGQTPRAWRRGRPAEEAMGITTEPLAPGLSAG